MTKLELPTLHQEEWPHRRTELVPTPPFLDAVADWLEVQEHDDSAKGRFKQELAQCYTRSDQPFLNWGRKSVESASTTNFYSDHTICAAPSALMRQALETLRATDTKSSIVQSVSGNPSDVETFGLKVLIASAKQRKASNSRWCLPELVGSVSLPILVATEEGAQALKLELSLVTLKNARLTIVPAPAQWVVPTTTLFAASLIRVQTWLRAVLEAKNAYWKDQALVWDLLPGCERGYGLLVGPSASASVALGALFLLREHAPPLWKDTLWALRAEDLPTLTVSAELNAVNPQREDAWLAGPLTGIGWAETKNGALSLTRAVFGNQVLHVASDQKVDAPHADVKKHASLLDLARKVAQLDIDSEDQHALRRVLLPALRQVGNLRQSSWPYPTHASPILPNTPDLEPLPALTGKRDYCDVRRRDHYALHRWATHALPSAGADDCIHQSFVNLTLRAQGTQIEYGSLGKLLEANSRVSAVLIEGDPGSGKSWLLMRHEQALCEQLLGIPPEKDELPVLPLYLDLSALPENKDPVAYFKVQLKGRYPNQRFDLTQCFASLGSGKRQYKLQVLLDGLNDVAAPAGQREEDRVREVVCALWATLQPELPMVLASRPGHQWNLGTVRADDRKFEVFTASLCRWGRPNIENYVTQRAVNQRWPLERNAERFMAQLKENSPLENLLGLPRHLHFQCMLWEAGATALPRRPNRLRARLLWLALVKELSKLSDHWVKQGLVADRDRAIAMLPYLSDPKTQPPAFRRNGLLFDGLFAVTKCLFVDQNPSQRNQDHLDLQEVNAVLEKQGIYAGMRGHWYHAIADLGLAQVDEVRGRIFPGSLFPTEWVAQRRVAKYFVGNVFAADPFIVERVRDACKRRSNVTIEHPDNEAYKKKYDSNQYVRRRRLERSVLLSLHGRRYPIVFVKADSGNGKTCFVRHLHEQLKDSVSVIPVLVRALNAPDLAAEIKAIAEDVLRHTGQPSQDPVDTMDQALQNAGVQLLVILDGVNEATGNIEGSNSPKFIAVFNNATKFLIDRVTAAKEGGTSFRLLVTSRPDRLTSWWKVENGQSSLTPLLQSIKRPSRPDRRVKQLTSDHAVVALKHFSASELDEALQKANIMEVSPNLRRMLSDPLLLGFYRQLVPDQKVFAPPRTPLELTDKYWLRQCDEIDDHAAKFDAVPKGKDHFKAVKAFCVDLLHSRQATGVVEWKDKDLAHVLVNEVLLFERVSNMSDGCENLRFRYDRLAELLIAKLAILEDPAGKEDSSQGISGKIVFVTLETIREGAFREVDVIRGALKAALQWRFETEDEGGGSSTFDLAIGLLDAAHPTLVGVPSEESQPCLLALSELVHDFLIEEARWDEKKIVAAINGWLIQHPRDEWSHAAHVLRRVVFNLLRDTDVSEAVASTESEESESGKTLRHLGAMGLLADASGDPAVLLHALHRDGKAKVVFNVLGEAVDLLKKLGAQLYLPGGTRAIKRMSLAMLLIAPNALSDKTFLDLIKRFFSELPAFPIALGAAVLTDFVLHNNAMPFRIEEWAGVGGADGEFRNVVALLTSDGWVDDAGTTTTAEKVLSLSEHARNGVITQLLSTSLSCRIATETDEATRTRLLVDLEKLAFDARLKASSVNSRDEDSACLLGSSAYLLSLVCYHLVVFDGPLSLRGQNRDCLPRDQAEKVYDIMWDLANGVLLQPPFLGQFKFRSHQKQLENSNIIGTLGRAAIELGRDRPREYLELIEAKTKEHLSNTALRKLKCRQLSALRAASRLSDDEEKLLAYAGFANFLLDSLATLATLCRNPQLALDCIYGVAQALRVPLWHKEERQDGPDVFELISMDFLLKALLQVRAAHPYRLETYLVENLGNDRAAPVLQRLRQDASIPLSRHFSWAFEHVIERVVVEYPDIVCTIRADTLENLNLRGLRVVTARCVYRLSAWTRKTESVPGQTVPNFVGSPWSRTPGRIPDLSRRRLFLSQVAGIGGVAGRPIGHLLTRIKRMGRAVVGFVDDVLPRVRPKRSGAKRRPPN